MGILKLITPINLSSERAKFFDNKKYNPQLKYHWSDAIPANWESSINTNFKNLAKAVLEQDTKQITKEAATAFDTKLENLILKDANEIISKPPRRAIDYSISELKDAFDKAINYLDLGYETEITDRLGFNIRPRHGQKKLLISKSSRHDYFSLDGAIKHEVTHVIRAVNGSWGEITKHPNYLPTEEGLASYFQDYKSEGGDASLFQHAAQYAATGVSLKGSFVDVFEYLVGLGFSEEFAWQRGIRHKFGFVDTSRPGNIMKPSMYFYHEQKIKQLTDEEKLRLLVGKIAVSDLPKYKEYKGKVDKEKLIEFFKLDI